MNTATTRLTHAVMIVAALAAIVIVAPVQAAPAQAPAVIEMPLVTVTGKRANFAPAVASLPTVTITGRRLERSEPVQAKRDDARPATAAVVVAMR
jgi:hypothetical protein